MGPHTRARLGCAIAAAVVAAAIIAPASAGAASVAYTDGGEVWLSSLDGTQKVRLATAVVNGDGDTEKWLDVAHADNGRIVAVRNKPGRMSSFSWFKIWEPDGTSTVEGPLNAPSGWLTYTYPLGFDITADGAHLVYGYSNTSGCCPISFGRGIYVRPATNSVLAPINLGSGTHPALLGNRLVALEDSFSPKIVQVQALASPGNPYNDEFTPWIDTSGVGLDANGVDIAATGQLAALGFEEWTDGTQTIGKVAVVSVQGLDAPPSLTPVDCFIPAVGVAREASLAPDGATIAWQDGGGVKVAGTPTTSADPCAMSSPPVVISPTGSYPSIGGADVARFVPPPAPPTIPVVPPTVAPPTGSTPGTPPPSSPGQPGVATKPAAPVLTLPSKLTARALATTRGVAIKVKVPAAGRITATGKVPATRMGRRGKAVTAATGRTTARRAGTVTVRLRFTAAARKRVRRLKGARLTVRVVHGGRATTKTITLR
jgi:hypothetical protein